MCYSAARKVPAWVGYEFTPDRLSHPSTRSSCFRRNTALESPTATNADYRHSGFSRGHLAPAADFAWSAEARRATYLLSNVVPQDQTMNAGRWSQAQSDAVYVFTGALFESPEPERIGPGQIAVPSHLFKVILAVQPGRNVMFAFIMPNDAAAARVPFASFLTSVNEVQERAGLDFFSALEDPEEQRLESAKPTAVATNQK